MILISRITNLSIFRLLNKVEDLERLMNDEVTDINEILNVINTIQVKQIKIIEYQNISFVFRLIKIFQR